MLRQSKEDSMFARTILTMSLVVGGLASFFVLAQPADARTNERNGVYAVKGNEFIIRKSKQGGYMRLRAYRKVGYLWERYGSVAIPLDRINEVRARVLSGRGGSITERIYFGGRLLGYSDIDVEDPINRFIPNNRRSYGN